MWKRALTATVVSVLALATGCAGTADKSDSPGQQKVTLTLNWYPYGEHAPFYAGKKNGTFAKHGIDLEIRAGQGSQKTVQATGAAQTDFGWADTSALLAAVEQGVPVRSVGVFLQTTPSSVQFFTEKKITKLSELKGRSIAVTAGDALAKTFPALLKKNGMSEADVRLQNTDPAGKLAAVISGQVDALLGYASDQGPIIQDKAGKDVSYLRYSDNGLNYFSNGLVVGDAFRSANPEVVRRMVAATSEAWAAAGKDAAAAVEAMQGVSPQLPPTAVVAKQFETTRTLLHTESTKGKAPGVNTEADWTETIRVFAEAGLISKPQPPSAYWDASFAPKEQG